MGNDLVGKAVEKAIGKFVDCVDVDGVVRRVEIDAVLNRIDINALLDRVDVNRHLSRVDVDALMKRIDVNEVVRRSDLGAMIAQSTTGVFTQILDVLRTHVVLLDLVFLRLARATRCKFRGVMRSTEVKLPPRPGQPQQTEENQLRYPTRKSEKAVAVQGRYSGFFSKSLAIFIDVIFLTLSFAVLVIIMEIYWVLFMGTSDEEAKQKVARDNTWVFILYCTYWWLYFFLCVALSSRTIGMGIAGIKVVNVSGAEPAPDQAITRTTLLPLTLTVLPPLGLIGFWRRDGRMLHDLAACTGLVYSWDAPMARARERALIRDMEQQQLQESIYYSSTSAGNSPHSSSGRPSPLVTGGKTLGTHSYATFPADDMV